LSELFLGDSKHRTYKQAHVNYYNGVFKFIVLDSLGGFTQLDRKLKFEAIISLRQYLSERPTLQEKKHDAEVTSFNKQSASLLFTFENKIGFLKIQKENKNLKSGFGHVMCKAAHYIRLVDA